ncbi:MAG: hypothetical protein WDN08_10660 [Rhizomicrobium sp.]
MSAKAGLALAKMRAEFSANFQVTKRTMAPGPDPALEYAKRAGDEAFWKRWRETFAREESAEGAEEEGEEEMGEGDPLSDSGGSNGPNPLTPPTSCADPRESAAASPGNRNRYRHGRYSGAARQIRRTLRAEIRAIEFVIAEAMAWHACDLARDASPAPAAKRIPASLPAACQSCGRPGAGRRPMPWSVPGLVL